MKKIQSSALVALTGLPFLAAEAQDFTNGPVQLPTMVVQAARDESIPQAQTSATTTVPGMLVGPGGIAAPRDLGALAPNVSVFDGNSDRTPRFSIRGFRENNFNIGVPAVGMYVDDVPYVDLRSRGVPLYDIDRIEFVRGSQGTLYGASGPGGVLNIVTKQPGNTTQGAIGGSYGNYDSQNYFADLGGAAIKDQLFLGISGIYSTRDGFVNNLSRNTRPNTEDTLSGRIQLRWTPAGPWSLSFMANGERFHDGFVPTYDPARDPDPMRVRRFIDGYVHTSDDNQALKITYTAEQYKMTSITAHRDWKQSLVQDFSFTPPFFPPTAGFDNPKLEQWSEEVRLQSYDPTSKLKWVAGMMFLDNNIHNNSGSTQFYGFPSPPFPFPIPSPNTFRTIHDLGSQSYAQYGQATETFKDKLDLTLGLRSTYDERSVQRARALQSAAPTIPFGGYNLSDTFYDLSPKFAAAYHFNPKIEGYASVTRGYQSGGFNPSIDKASQSEYNPANSWQGELGVKSGGWAGRTTANADVFYNETSGYQAFRFNPLDPTQSYVVNANRASSYGAEIELAGRPQAKLEWNAGAGYTHAIYDSFRDTGTGVVYDGRTISFAPEFTAHFGATYYLQGNYFIRGEVQGVGQYFLDDANSASQQAFALVNAEIGYQTKNISASFFARNIFDQRYYQNALELPAPTGTIREIGDPLMFGFSLTAHF